MCSLFKFYLYQSSLVETRLKQNALYLGGKLSLPAMSVILVLKMSSASYSLQQHDTHDQEEPQSNISILLYSISI